jgi:DnaJ-domain-containing protein 1
MKKQILDALFRYEGMFRSRKRELQDEKKGLEKAIAEAEGDIVAARGLRHKFVDAAKLTREEISEVKDSVLR